MDHGAENQTGWQVKHQLPLTDERHVKEIEDLDLALTGAAWNLTFLLGLLQQSLVQAHYSRWDTRATALHTWLEYSQTVSELRNIVDRLRIYPYSLQNLLMISPLDEQSWVPLDVYITLEIVGSQRDLRAEELLK